ncbi:hypothetical protein HAX54_017813, partial [Datura stramonium]|nr:hypothetical protein [Datura stramonium]
MNREATCALSLAIHSGEKPRPSSYDPPPRRHASGSQFHPFELSFEESKPEANPPTLPEERFKSSVVFFFALQDRDSLPTAFPVSETEGMKAYW